MEETAITTFAFLKCGGSCNKQFISRWTEIISISKGYTEIVYISVALRVLLSLNLSYYRDLVSLVVVLFE